MVNQWTHSEVANSTSSMVRELRWRGGVQGTTLGRLAAGVCWRAGFTKSGGSGRPPRGVAALLGNTPPHVEHYAPPMDDSARTDALLRLGADNPRTYLATARPAAELKVGGQAEPAGTHSRLGGLPRLAKTQSWPELAGEPLALVAQINLDEVPTRALDIALPTSGLLSFFYDNSQAAWGFDPNDVGSWAVLYSPDVASTEAAETFPEALDADSKFEATTVSIGPRLTYPSMWSLPAKSLFPNAAQDPSDADYAMFWPPEDPGRGLIGGHPDQLQGDMQVPTELTASRGIDVGHGDWPTVTPDIVDAASQWQLLLQVPSVDSAGMMWGDLGFLYFWIRDEDLREQRFDRVWLQLQCG